MDKEFFKINPCPIFQDTMIVDPKFFIDRSEELIYAWNALFRDRQNLLVTGPRAIGKSSFLRIITHELSSNEKINVLPVPIDMQAFSEGTINVFLNEIIERTCSTIATKIFRMDYSEFIDSVNKAPKLKQSFNKHQMSLFRIFRIVKSMRIDRKRKVLKEVGAKMVGEAKVSETDELSTQFKEITGYEFLMFTDELNNIIRSKGFESILILCDEANRLSEEINVDIFQNYLEIFSSKNIQFVFVTISSASNKVPALSSIFSSQIKLSRFPDHKAVKELIGRVYEDFEERGGNPIPFSADCYLKIYDICEGHPRWIQRLCNRVYKFAFQENKKSIDLNFVNNCGLRFLKELQSLGWTME